jgi:hypothetical protein
LGRFLESILPLGLLGSAEGRYQRTRGIRIVFDDFVPLAGGGPGIGSVDGFGLDRFFTVQPPGHGQARDH